MKKIQPARRYNLDDGYPSDADATNENGDGTTRRGALGVTYALIRPGSY